MKALKMCIFNKLANYLCVKQNKKFATPTPFELKFLARTLAINCCMYVAEKRYKDDARK